MKAKYETYLEKIDLSSETVKNNVDLIINYASKLCNDKIIDIFVNDYYEADGSRAYGSLFLVSERYICEARNFRNTGEYDIDVAPIKDGIIYFRTSIKDYDFKNATRESRLMVECASETGTSFQLKASYENCSKLNEIIDKYIKPNMEII
jgi:hypothetical protein